MLGEEVPGHCEQQLAQTLIKHLFKMHFLHRSLILKSQQNWIDLVTRLENQVQDINNNYIQAGEAVKPSKTPSPPEQQNKEPGNLSSQLEDLDLNSTQGAFKKLEENLSTTSASIIGAALECSTPIVKKIPPIFPSSGNAIDGASRPARDSSSSEQSITSRFGH